MTKHTLAAFVGGFVLALALGLIVRASAQTGGGAYLRLWDDSGAVREYQCAEVPQDATPTPEGNTATPAPQVTATPMPTTAPTMTATATLTPIPLCWGVIAVDSLNIRSSPWGTVVTTYPLNTRVGIIGGVYDTRTPANLWYKLSDAPALYAFAQWVTLGQGAQCDLPPEPQTQAPASRLGLHLTVGASLDVVMAALPRLGSLKGTTGTENILQAARKERPNLLILYRIVAPDCPPGWGSGDAQAVADSWWSTRYTAWQRTGLMDVVDAWEPVNECGYPGSAWENAFWIRTLENADMAGLCLAVFSDSYGTPQILEYQYRAPVLNWILAHPCQPGRYHIMALHSYEGVDSGAYKFGRYELFMRALGEKYRAVPIVFTEYAYNTGNPPVDCGALWADWRQASVIFEADPQVWAATLFNVSPAGGWGDVSPCF